MFTLPNKRVLIKPILREGKWLDKGHSGNFMYDNTRMVITLPISHITGRVIDPLTPEEKEFFENPRLSGLNFKPGDLSVSDLESKTSFWAKREVSIYKKDGVLTDDSVLMELDLSNPLDYLDYKLLLANSRSGGVVAPSWEERFNQGTYRIALVDSDYKYQEETSKAVKLAKAYEFFNSLMKSQQKMYEFLMVYWLENKKAAKPSKDSSQEWLIGQIQNIIDNNLNGFLKLINSNYKEKLFIHKAIEAGALSLVNNTFVTTDGLPVGNNLEDVIMYFKDERNQEQRLKLIALINNNNDSSGNGK